MNDHSTATATSPWPPPPEAVEQLKRDWVKDPCWDIERTTGFGDYYDELLAFRRQKEAELAAKRETQRRKIVQSERADTVQRMEDLAFSEPGGTHDRLNFVIAVIAIERAINRLADRIDALVGAVAHER